MSKSQTTFTDEYIHNLDNEFRTDEKSVRKKLESLSITEHTKLLLKIIDMNTKIENKEIKNKDLTNNIQ